MEIPVLPLVNGTSIMWGLPYLKRSCHTYTSAWIPNSS
jgi:hypothetical protein